MGGLFITPVPALLRSTCSRRRRGSSISTPSPFLSHPTERAAAAACAQPVLNTSSGTSPAALLALSGVLTALALALPALVPADRASTIGLRVVPVYTLVLHLRSLVLHLVATCRPRGRIEPHPLSAAWLATAALAAILGFRHGLGAPLRIWWVYAALAVCALAECALVRGWGEAIFVVPPPRVRMRVGGDVVEAERKLEEGAAGKEKTLSVTVNTAGRISPKEGSSE
jgi:hypothetical protein